MAAWRSPCRRRCDGVGAVRRIHVEGTWGGDWGPTKDNQTHVVLEFNWDGKTITGNINPGPKAVPFRRPTLAPPTWMVHIEGDWQGCRRRSGSLTSSTARWRTSARVSAGAERHVVAGNGCRQPSASSETDRSGYCFLPKIGWPKSSVSRCRCLLFSWQMYSASSPLGVPAECPTRTVNGFV